VRISAALFYLVFAGGAHLLALRWALATVPIARKRRRLAWAVAITLALLPVTLRLATRWTHAPGLLTLLAVALVETCAVALSALPLAALSLVRRVVVAVSAIRRGEAAGDAPPVPKSEPGDDGSFAPRGVARDVGEVEVPIGRREAIERGVGIASFVGSGALLGWGAVVGRHSFELREVVVKVPSWPRALDGYTIAQVSDLHAGVFVGEREMGEGFELVRRAKPDLVVATGDLVDYDATLSHLVAKYLHSVSPRDGAFAILGNHDHYAGAYQVRRRLLDAGIPVLLNQGRVLRAGDGGGFALLGVDDLMGRRDGGGPDFGRAAADVPRELPRVLLAHQPTYFHEVAGTVALQLSGHTHGGQVNPGFRPANALMEFIDGRYEREGSVLWVNRGFGVVGPPSRVGAPPEITKIVIVSG
jgi:uncharacterized protein